MTEATTAADRVPEAMPASTDAVVVRLGAGRFAIDLGWVAEVGKVPTLTRVPGLPAWLSGVANWRGRILPVLDLRAMLGAERSPLGSTGRLVVLVAEAATVGLLVEAVDGTTTVGTDVAPFPPALPTGAELLSGQLPREDGPIAILDVAAVIRLRDELPQGRRTA